MNWDLINKESKKLTNSLKKIHLTISTAESCTGGMVASSIIHNPGSSVIFKKGYITYSNQSKISELYVEEDIIREFGSVSKECSIRMINGLFTKTNTDLGISITGIAGPKGDTNNKPVGLVWISYGNILKKISIRFVFEGNRLMVRLKTTYNALKLTNDFVKKYHL